MNTVEVLAAADVRPLRHAVLRPHQRPEELVVEADGPGVRHLGVREAGRLVAVGSISPGPHPHDPRPGDFRIRGMAAEPEARGRGLGTAILSALLDHARAQGARRVWCNARTPARGLYERAGLVAEGDEFELPGIGPHLLMAMEL